MVGGRGIEREMMNERGNKKREVNLWVFVVFLVCVRV